ncbi:heterokaryon incompatibility protein-domain-containing protein [Leptodontidium sp. 2 PMI_412]|nr:heterokaryon incompatibility protein-domain-containing protein [Leptodontidium sp. 2 PMI_412]
MIIFGVTNDGERLSVADAKPPGHKTYCAAEKQFENFKSQELTTTEMDSYQYQDLPTDEQGDIYIRLVQFYPTEKETGIPPPCSITEVPLSKCPKYEAVSYFWGSPLDQGQIICDGKTITVPVNLYGFLSRMRLKAANRKFWIDSVCINQSNEKEKSSQVAEMRNIYANASRTLVWLGAEADQSTLALQFAARCSETLSDLNPSSAKRRSLWYRTRTYSEFSIFSNSWFAFFKLLDRAWFLRAWIVQEVALSTNTKILCGPTIISWSELYRALYYIINYQIWIFEFYGSPQIEVLMALQSSQFEISQGRKRIYWQVLSRHRKALASNARDNVFAFYGLSSHESFKEHSIAPNYSESVRSVYMNVAISTLRMATNLDFLSIARLEKKSGDDLNLPSWVPDWSHSDNYCQSFLLFEAVEGDMSIKFPYSATKDSKCSPIIHEALGQLEVSGYVVDRLARVSSHWELQDTTGYQSLRKQAMVLQRNQAYVHEWEATIDLRSDPNSKYPTGETLEEASWQTFVAGQAADNKDAIRPLYYKFRQRQRYLLWIHKRGLDNHIWIWMLVVILGHILRFVGIPNPEMGFRTLTSQMINRRIAKTEKGYIGLIPRLAEEDDYVVLLKGGKFQIVLRLKGEGVWEFIGDSYMHGMTRGEFWDEGKCSTFRLI